MGASSQGGCLSRHCVYKCPEQVSVGWVPTSWELSRPRPMTQLFHMPGCRSSWLFQSAHLNPSIPNPFLPRSQGSDGLFAYWSPSLEGLGLIRESQQLGKHTAAKQRLQVTETGLRRADGATEDSDGEPPMYTLILRPLHSPDLQQATNLGAPISSCVWSLDSLVPKEGCDTFLA